MGCYNLGNSIHNILSNLTNLKGLNSRLRRKLIQNYAFNILWLSFPDCSSKIEWDRMFQSWKLDTRRAFVTKHNKRVLIMFMVLVDTKGCIWRFWASFLHSSWKIDWDRMFQSKKFNTLRTFDLKQSKRAQMAFTALVDPKGCIWHFWGSFLDSSWKIAWDSMFQSRKLNTLRAFDRKQSKRAQIAFTPLVGPKGCVRPFWAAISRFIMKDWAG